MSKSELTISRHIAAPPSAVWGAWSDPAKLARWWIPAPIQVGGALKSSSLWRSHGEVAARSADGGAMARRPGPSTIRFVNGPPPHACRTGRIKTCAFQPATP